MRGKVLSSDGGIAYTDWLEIDLKFGLDFFTHEAGFSGTFTVPESCEIPEDHLTAREWDELYRRGKYGREYLLRMENEGRTFDLGVELTRDGNEVRFRAKEPAGRR